MIQIGDRKDFIKLEVHDQGCCDSVPVRIPEGRSVRKHRLELGQA